MLHHHGYNDLSASYQSNCGDVTSDINDVTTFRLYLGGFILFNLVSTKMKVRRRTKK